MSPCLVIPPRTLFKSLKFAASVSLPPPCLSWQATWCSNVRNLPPGHSSLLGPFQLTPPFLGPSNLAAIPQGITHGLRSGGTGALANLLAACITGSWVEDCRQSSAACKGTGAVANLLAACRTWSRVKDHQQSSAACRGTGALAYLGPRSLVAWLRPRIVIWTA
jgi:hypothetical protein